MSDSKSVSLKLSKHQRLTEDEISRRGSTCKLYADKSCLPNFPEKYHGHDRSAISEKYSKHLDETKLNKEQYSSEIGCAEFRNLNYATHLPKYLPQPQDKFPYDDSSKSMGPIGPWATGKVDFNTMGGLIGLRPVVDRFSITRFSEGQWRRRNMEILEKSISAQKLNESNEKEFKELLETSSRETKNAQLESTKQLQDREKEMIERESTLRQAINDMIEEISVLDDERIKLKKSLVVLKLPAAIVSECLDRRAGRTEPELIKDDVEELLIKELAQIAEIRRSMNETLEKIEDQLVENKTAQARLEYDWSNKKDAIDIEVRNISLNNSSTINMYKAGATKFSPWQASLQYWNYFTKEILELCENTRKKSIDLRSTLTDILKNAARDLRKLANTVDEALQRKIEILQDAAICLEKELKLTLQNLVQTEKRIENMRTEIYNLQKSIKVAQTRLDNRKLRVDVENTFDIPQQTLIHEVEIIQNNIDKMQSFMVNAENVKNELIVTRGTLEREISLKYRSLLLEKDRLQLLRSHFPTESELIGSAHM